MDRPPRPRTLGATRRAHRRGHRGRSYSRHFLLRPPTPPRPAAGSRSDTAVVDRVADTTRSVCAAGPHRTVALSAAVAPGCGARTLTQHREPRVATTRRSKPHLPQRLRGTTLERQSPAHLRADRPRLQRPATVEEGSPQRRCRSGPGLARRRSDAALPAPAPAGERVGTADATVAASAASASCSACAADPTHLPICRRRLGRLRRERRCRVPRRAERAAR